MVLLTSMVIVLFFVQYSCVYIKNKEIAMKRIFIATIIVVLFTIDVSAMDYYNSLCSRISSLGQSIEHIDTVPVIGKLTNLLPFAVLATSFKECPMQTMAVLAVLGAYILSYNDAVREMVEKYEIMNNVPWIRKNQQIVEKPIDDNFFVYDEDDSESSDDDLLDDDLLDDEDNDDIRKIKQRKSVRSTL